MSDPIEGERGVSAVASTRRQWFGRKQRLASIVLGLAFVLGFIAWKAPSKKPDDDEQKITKGAIASDYKAPAAPAPPALIQAANSLPVPSTPNLNAPNLNTQVQSAVKPAAVQGTMLSYAAGPLPPYLQPKKPEQASAAAGKDAKTPQGTQVAFAPTTIPGSQSGTVADQTMILWPGLVRCTMQTAINSEQAGPFQCQLPQDVLSRKGVVLMEKGTEVIGDYKSGAAQGQKRIIAITATAYTPNGVVVPLGGPIADEVGTAGVEGNVDNHYFARFGAAIILSLVDSGLQVLSSSLQKGNSTSINLNTGGTEGLASQVLQATINIPPTITLPQGIDVNLWVRQPIDFGPSYKLVNAR
jgi:type IV secretion system protein VirB10